MSGVEVTVTQRETDRAVCVSIVMPFDEYTRSLFPNEYLRVKVNESLTRVLDEAHNRR